MNEIRVNRGTIKKGNNFVTLRDEAYQDVKLIGDKKVNDGEGYNGICIEKDSQVLNCEVCDFGGYGIVASNGKNHISIYDVKDEDGATVYGVSYKNLEKVDDKHIHLIKRLNVEKFPQFELGYTMGYGGYNYCNGRNYVAKFYDADDKLIAEVEGRQYDKMQVPKEAKLVDFVIEQDYLPTRGNGDFNGAVLFVSDYDCPKVEIKDCYVHDQSRENIAVCGGQGVHIDGCKLEKTWIGLCIEDGWELCKDVVVENCEFEGNGRDVIVAGSRNLEFKNNVFRAWVNIGNRVEGLKFNNNVFDVSAENHKSTNDRFVVEVHKDDVEICDNVFKRARVQLHSDDYAKDGNAKVVKKRNIFEDTPITAMDKLFVCEEAVIKGKPERLVGQYKACEFYFDEVDACGMNVKESRLHDISRCKFQQPNVFEDCEIKKVGFEIFNDYKGAEAVFRKCKLEDVKFAINSRGQNDVKFLVEDCEIHLTKPMIDMWNCTGKGTYHFKDCKIVADNIDYLCKTAWTDGKYDDYRVIFENCEIVGVKEMANNRMKKHITVL